MEQISDGQFVRRSVISAASMGFSAGIFVMMGLQYVLLRDSLVGWIELGSVPVFVACIYIVYRRAAKRFP
jgi:drug/metabolite transporter (DMT)-like permease